MLRAVSMLLIATGLAFSGAGCWTRPAEPPPEGHTVDVNTEGASFYLFHPDDLQHRKASPMEWVLYEFALAPEFAAGNLVAFDTGADGTFRIRLTQGQLSPREEKYRSCSWDYRYKVRHGRVLIDGGEFLPSDSTSEVNQDLPDLPAGPQSIPHDQWFTVPNGDYKVAVHAIDWTREPGAVDARDHATKSALPAYVIQFQPVPSLGSIGAITCTPRLEPGPGAKPMFHPVSVDGSGAAPNDEPLPESCPVIVAPALNVVPGFDTERIEVPVAGIAASPTGPDEPPQFEPAIVLIDSEQMPRLGALSSVGGGTQQDGGSWKVAFRVSRLVNVKALANQNGRLIGKIADFQRPSSQVTPEDVATLKATFAAYAKSSKDYRTKIRHADYEAERVAAIQSTPVLTSTLIHHVPMSPATRARLLPLSDAERVKELLALLKTEAGR